MKSLMKGLSAILLVLGALTAEAYDTLQHARSGGIIVLGYQPNSEPLSKSSDTRSGDPQGFSIDLCKEVVAELEKEIGLDNIAIKWVQTTPALGIEMIKTGKMHMLCGSVTNTIERQKEVDFSYITFVTGSKVLVKRGSNYRSIWDLSGKRIAVFRGTTAEKVFDSRLVQDGGLKAEKLVVENRDEGIRAVKSGDAGALLSDDILLE